MKVVGASGVEQDNRGSIYEQRTKADRVLCQNERCLGPNRK
jgi:hypothetical protein